MQTADKNRDPRHINRCQLSWMAKRRKQFSLIKIYSMLGRRCALQKARAAGHMLAPTSHTDQCWAPHPHGQELLSLYIQLVSPSQLRLHWRDRACKPSQEGLNMGQHLPPFPRELAKGCRAVLGG